MSIEYKNDNFKIITEQQFKQNFSGYKDNIVNNIIKTRERYLDGNIFALHYYKNINEIDSQIVEQHKNLPNLEVLSIREREAYGEFWIDKIKYFDLEANQFSQLIVRELYNNNGQIIAWECTDPSLPSSNEHHYELTKSYYKTTDGFYGEYFDSHYKSGVFSDIEYFSNGINTDDQDVERGIYGVYAEQLMIRMNIPQKMRAWYVNNQFLPEL
ncbi:MULTISPECIES: hypothetical protein [unclassified Chryseobacterium]|uniref:hypothetical protein n=1 Tax=unclassified Chryseobacterium TaxID=2593645 RepID=UPI001D616B3A|nr:MULTISPECIES: hypothetical protein [unclassified Chryseobacterium]MCQ9635824.1 hypothetical protein [Chryseobacterium sp. WG23]CAH0215961.1 hypothetical protein SRABI04_02353 [Chryseobacterium sp. Bi04]